MYKNFIDIDQLSKDDLNLILSSAKDLKKNRYNHPKYIDGKSIITLFEKTSTRTKVSFEIGINELGANPIYLTSKSSQIGKGETIHDTANVLSRYAALIMARVNSHNTLLEFAQYGNVPIINGLSDFSHPCQIIADILTYEEHKNCSIENANVTWIGDFNNVTNSWVHAALIFGFKLNIVCPKKYSSKFNAINKIINENNNINVYHDIQEIDTNSDLIITDTWVSMGDVDVDERIDALKDFQVNETVMKNASPNAIFMHCLPAYRGMEVTNNVIDGKQSVVFDEAENRLHAQKAIILWCLNII